MGIWEWLGENWFNLFGSAGIAGLWVAAITLRDEAKERRNGNLLAITAGHRKIWQEYLNNPKLARIRDATADTISRPVTEAEKVFVTFVILHAGSVYYTMRDKQVVKMEGLRRDLAEFLSLPIPREIWEKIKVLQNDDFVAFVESCRNWK